MSEQPLVLIAARDPRRGREIETLLGRDGRVAVLGVHTRLAPLLRAIAAVRTSVVVLDTDLEDASALTALHACQFERAVGVVALTTPISGQLSFELVRSGAIDVMVWDGTEEIARDLATSLIAAAQTTLATVSRPLFEQNRQPASPRRDPARHLVPLIGTRRGTLLSNAALRLSGDIDAALLCARPVHRTAMPGLLSTLDRLARLRVRSAPVSTIAAGSIVAFNRHAVLERRGGHLKIARDDRLDHSTEVDEWLGSLAQITGAMELTVTVVSSGQILPSTISTLSRMLSTGISLARSIEGGFQVRWAGTGESRRLSVDTFWSALDSRLRAKPEAAA